MCRSTHTGERNLNDINLHCKKIFLEVVNDWSTFYKKMLFQLSDVLTVCEIQATKGQIQATNSS